MRLDLHAEGGYKETEETNIKNNSRRDKCK
jgi:hypothetical protein